MTAAEDLSQEKADVQQFIDSWQEKTQHLSADLRSSCMQRVRAAAQGLLRQLAQDLSKGVSGPCLQAATSQALMKLNHSMDAFYQTILKSAHQRTVTQHARVSLEGGLNHLSLSSPSVFSQSSARTFGSLWQKVTETNANAFATPQASDSPQHLAFPGERELNHYLDDRLRPLSQ